jgi:hypothetical protein
MKRIIYNIIKFYQPIYMVSHPREETPNIQVFCVVRLSHGQVLLHDLKALLALQHSVTFIWLKLSATLQWEPKKWTITFTITTVSHTQAKFSRTSVASLLPIWEDYCHILIWKWKAYTSFIGVFVCVCVVWFTDKYNMYKLHAWLVK